MACRQPTQELRLVKKQKINEVYTCQKGEINYPLKTFLQLQQLNIYSHFFVLYFSICSVLIRSQARSFLLPHDGFDCCV